jgi:hypothetical protein
MPSPARGSPFHSLDWRSNANPPPVLGINGYIVQVDTMPQASGSPVFVRRSFPISAPDPDAKPKPVEGKPNLHEVSVIRGEVYGSIWLLGLWHGAWTNDVSKMLGLSQGSVNLGMGMGVTVPAPRILEVLDQPDLVALREVEKAERMSKPTVSPQSESKSTVKPTEGTLDPMLRTLRKQPRTAPAKRRVKDK